MSRPANQTPPLSHHGPRRLHKQRSRPLHGPLIRVPAPLREQRSDGRAAAGDDESEARSRRPDSRRQHRTVSPHQYRNRRSTPCSGCLPERACSSHASRAPDEAAGADAASQPLHICAQKMAILTHSKMDRAIYGMDANPGRWSLSIGTPPRRLENLRPGLASMLRAIRATCFVSFGGLRRRGPRPRRADPRRSGRAIWTNPIANSQ